MAGSLTCSLALSRNPTVLGFGFAPGSSLAPMVKSVYARQPLGKREATIVKRLRTVGRLPVSLIASIVERHKKTIYKVLKGNTPFAVRGPKPKLQKRDVDRLVATLNRLVRVARGRYEDTLRMLKERTNVKLDDKVVRKALHARKIRFRKMRTKPLLTKVDRKERFAFARKYRVKSRQWWLNSIHLHIDLKNFQVYTHARARDYAAMREVRGAYRAPGQGLDEAYVVLPKDLRYNPGARSCRIAAGVGGGRVLVWHDVGKVWSGAAAAELYEGPIHQALARQWPTRREWTVLEDNDPTGFKSRKGEIAKQRSHIKIFTIPRRSPDLNVCDYALWKQINRTMRRQEKTFPRTKRETRVAYIARLRKAAMGLKKAFVDSAIGNMHERCQRLYAAKGGHFQEGGR